MKLTSKKALYGALLLASGIGIYQYRSSPSDHSSGSSSPSDDIQIQSTVTANQSDSPEEALTTSTPSQLKGNYDTSQLNLLENTEDGTRYQLDDIDDIQFETLQVGSSFTWKISSNYNIRGTVDSYHQNKHGISFGVTLDDSLGRMTFKQNQVRQVALLFFNGQRTAHRLTNEENGWVLLDSFVNELRCASAVASYPVATEHTYPRKTQVASAPLQIPLTSPLVTSDFQSRPGAPTVIYCDFDGETVNQPDWSSSTINAAASGLTDTQIALIMQMVAEDFAPFDVNVTNVRSVFDSTNSNQRVMCISTPTDTAEPDSGGVAFLDSFVDNLVCWNFNLYDAVAAADTISHEVGHTLNLEHDGNAGNEYYDGHSAGNEFWVPIMGSADSPTISQWSKGEYYQANRTEDDLAIISNNGLSFRPDDYGNNSASAHAVTLNSEPITLEGVIGNRNDIDVFEINFTDLGSLSIQSVVDNFSTNLDVRMRVYDSSDTLLINYNSEDTKAASADFTLQPGTYEVWIEGDSTGSPNSSSPTGWTDYGSLGVYCLSLTPDPPSRAAALDNFGVTLTDIGSSPWFTQTAETHDGEDALESGIITDSGTTRFTISKQATSVSFWYKVSSEQGWDYLEFRIDGVLRGEWSGESGWVQYTRTNLSNSTHTFDWRYVKDSLYAEGKDTAWLDELEFNNDSNYGTWANANAASSEGNTDENGNGTADLLDYGIIANNLAGVKEGQIILLPTTHELNFYRNPERADIVIRIQVSGTLETWETVAVSNNGANFFTKTGVSVTHTTIDSQNQKISLDLSTGGDPKQFARIRVSRQ